MTDFFSLFDLPNAFDLDSAALEKAYFAQQRQYHPDRMAAKPEKERIAALQHSMTINEAYQALRQPLTRAEHMLANQNILVNTEKDSVKPTPMLLTEIMEWRERLADAADMASIQQLANETETAYRETMQLLSTSFQKQDWQNAAQATLRLGYLEKLRHEIKIRSQKFGKAS